MFQIFKNQKQQELQESLDQLSKYVDDVKLYYHEEIKKQKLLTAFYKKELDKKINFTPTLDEIEYFNTEVSRLKIENEKLLEQNNILKEDNKKIKSKVNYNAKKRK